MLDTRGLSCPMPVVMVQQELDGQEELTVLADNRTAVENITRFAASKRYTVSVAEQDGEYTLTLRRNAE